MPPNPNPHAALPEEANLVRKKISPRPRRMWEIKTSVIEAGRVKLTVDIIETGNNVVATRTVNLPLSVLSSSPNDRGKETKKTAMEDMLKKYDQELKASELVGDSGAF